MCAMFCRDGVPAQNSNSAEMDGTAMPVAWQGVGMCVGSNADRSIRRGREFSTFGGIPGGYVDVSNSRSDRRTAKKAPENIRFPAQPGIRSFRIVRGSK